MARRIGLAFAEGSDTSISYTDSFLATLSAYKLSDPEPITEYVSVPGRLKGDLNLSNALTDGRITYKNRTLTFRLEVSSFDMPLRNWLRYGFQSSMVGRVMKFYIPDRLLGDYVKGVLELETITHDLNHLIIDFKSIVEPWVYKDELTTVTYGASTEPVAYVFNSPNDEDFIIDKGAVFDHEVVITGGDYTIAAADGSWSYTLSEGKYYLPELCVGVNESVDLLCQGTGTCTITYREAFL